METLAGKRALVTGAGVRVGRAIADHLADQGMSVAFHWHRSRAGAEEGAARARAKGLRACALEADLADWKTARALPGRAAEALGGLDLVVSSAAIFERVPFEQIGEEALRRMLGTNFEGPFALAQGAVPWLRASRGSLVHLLDVAAQEPWRGYAHYGASKAALAMLTRELALELAPEIRVNGVAPGTILWPASYGEAERARELARIPLGREGSPRDVAEAVAFLAASGYVTGEILRVDGGRGI